jgi:SAM-dependent methyltransferase
MTQLIFDSHKRWRNRQFYKPNWLMDAMYKGIREHMAFILQEFKTALVIHPYDDVMQTWLRSKGIHVEVLESPSAIGDIYANEDLLPLNPNTFDLIISPLNLQWINDLPGYLRHVLSALTSGGVFLAVCPGGDSLIELRHACLHVDLAWGMVSPHTSPMLGVATAAHLLQHTGFKNPVADREIVHHEYAHVKDLWHDLRNMGQSNGLLDRARGLHTPRYLDAVQQEYLKQFKTITATFDMLYLTGWKG